MAKKIDREKAGVFPQISFLELGTQFPEKKLFILENEKNEPTFLTGKELVDKTKIWGSILQQQLASQEKALLLLPQGLEYICAMMACFYANVTAIPTSIINIEQKEQIVDKISPILKSSQAACIITDTYFKDYLETVQDFSSIPLVNIDETVREDLVCQGARVHTPEDLAMLLYTSGSISQPKGVMLSHRNLLSQASIGAAQWGINQESRIVSWMPQFHNFGLFFNILAPLLKGACTVILAPDSFIRKPQNWFKTIQQYQATHTAAPNFAFDYCYSSIDMASVNQFSLSSLQAIICGGEPVNRKTYENFMEKFHSMGVEENVFCPHYGMSEIGSITTKKSGQPMHFLNLDIQSLELGIVKHTYETSKCKAVTSCGQIGEGVKVLIAHPESGEPCSAEEIGEIWIKSASVGMGYYQQVEETKKTFFQVFSNPKEEEFLRTGDLGFIEDNHLYIVGREKEVIIIHGKNHHPVDIEWTIKKYIPSLTLPATVFSSAINNEEKVVVIQEVEILQSELEYKKLVNEILRAVSEEHGLEIYEISLVKSGSIPRSSSGKVQRKACRNCYVQHALPVVYRYCQEISKLPRPIQTVSLAVDREILETLKTKVFLPVLKISAARLDEVTFFGELGLNSILYIQLSREIEVVFETQFTPVMLFKYCSLEQLVQYLAAQIKKTDEKVTIQTTEREERITSPKNIGENDIAIIGISGRFPGGAVDLESFWENLQHQNDGITPISQSRPRIIEDYQKKYGDVNDSWSQWGGFIDDFATFDAPFFGISPMEAECMDPQQRKLLELAWSVIENGGYAPSKLAGENIGLFVGVHNNDYAELVSSQPDLIDTYGAFLDSGLHMSMIANRVSRWFDFHGPSEVINTACSSSLVAVHHAVKSLCRGESRLAIAGGINLILASRIYCASQKAGMLSQNGRCKTFDQAADGFVRAEGYGAVFLKPYSQAVKDRDTIYGIIKGAVINHDGRSNSLRAPNLNAQKELIKAAFLESGLAPETISYIETHGTGTSLGDPIEIQALQEAFQEVNPVLSEAFCGLGTVKTNIGHCESAAGIAGLIKVLLSMRHQTLPGILHFKNINPYISLKKSPFYIVEQTQKWKRLKNAEGEEIPLRAGISSFGFGGTNAHVIVEEYMAENPAQQTSLPANNTIIIPLSAKNMKCLQAYAEQLRVFLQKSLVEENNQRVHFASINLLDLAYTLQTGREAMEERVIFFVKEIPEFIQKLDNFLQYKEGISDCWQGRIKQGKNLFALLGNDEDSQEMIHKWIMKGKYDKIAQYWVQGGTVNWDLFYEETRPRRINLPTYCFGMESYWLLTDAMQPLQQANNSSLSKRQINSSIQRKKAFLHKQWEFCLATPTRKVNRTIAILATPETSNLAAELAKHFSRNQVLHIHDLESPIRLSEQEWQNYDGWIDLIGCGKEKLDLMGWVAWLQQLIEYGHKENLMLLCVTQGLESYQNSTVNLAGANHVGLYRMLQSEYSGLQSRHLDIDTSIDHKVLAEEIVSEFLCESADSEICCRNGKRNRAHLREKQIKSDENQSVVFPEEYVLWITGGTRGLGYLCAQHFVTHYGVKRLVLSGREVFPPRETWDSQQHNTLIAQKIQAVQSLEAQGVQVQVLSVSLTDAKAIQKSLQEIKVTMGVIGGVIHCAGLDDSQNPAFIRKTLDGIRQVFTPKVSGLDNLYQCFQNEPLQFLLLFSSAAATIPALAAGYSDYAMANVYMDYFAEAKSYSCPIISIQWPNWKETGLGEIRNKAYELTGLLSHTNAEGLQLLDQIIANKMGPVILPAVTNPSLWKPHQLMQHAIHTTPSIKEHLYSDIIDTAQNENFLIKETQRWLIQLVSKELRMNPVQLDIETPFADYGVDSILLAQLSRSIGQLVKTELNISILLEYPSIKLLASRLVSAYADVIAEALGRSLSEDSGIENEKSAAYLPSNPSQKQEAVRSLLSARPYYQEESRPDIAVTGISCRFPGAGSLEEYWQLLAEGRSAIRPVPQERWGYSNQYFAGLLDNANCFASSVFMISEEDAKSMDPQALALLEESFKLWKHAGYSMPEIKEKPVGVYIGARSQYQSGDSGFCQHQNPLVTAGQNYLAANISKFFDLRGPSLVVDTACSSALVGMNMAVQALHSGEISAAIVGGISLLQSDYTHRLFEQRGILNKEPFFHIFDQRAGGVVLGEGVGLVLLKTVEQALKDGDCIYAVIKGIAVNNDGRTAGPATPNLQAQKEVMEMTLAKSGKEATEISYIETNGSGTEVTDLLELKAIEAVYRSSDTSPLSLGSMKPNIGHPLCAEGIAGFIKIALMLHHRKWVPFLSGKQPMRHYDFEASPFYFCRALTEWSNTPRNAAMNCFADGGTNAHVILEAWEEMMPRLRERQPLPVAIYNQENIRGTELKQKSLSLVEPSDGMGLMKPSWWAKKNIINGEK